MPDELWPTNTNEILGNTTEVIASTDAYGLCMAVALSQYAESQGKKINISCNFPDNSPGLFWINSGRDASGAQSTIQKLSSNAERVHIIGIPFNNFGGPTTLSASQEALNDYRKAHPNQNVTVANKRIASPRDATTSIIPSETDITDQLETTINKFYEDNKELYPINYIKLARFCAFDTSVLDELTEEEKKEFSKLALAIEIASRPSILWHQGDVVTTVPIGTKVILPEPNKNFNDEANRRIQQAIYGMKAFDKDYFYHELECFRDNFRTQIVTLGVEQQGNVPPKLAFFDIGDTPVGLHFTSLKMVQEQTGAEYVVALSITGNKSVMKVYGNWKSGKSPDNLHTIESLKERGLWVAGNKNLRSIGVSSNKEDPNSGVAMQGCAELILEICPEINSVFEGVRTIAVVGNPNSGKSTLAYMLAKESNRIAGVNVAVRIDGDPLSPTPDSFLKAISAFNLLKALKTQGFIVEEAAIAEAQEEAERQALQREALKRNAWSEELDQLQKWQLAQIGIKPGKLTIIDLPGGLEMKNQDGIHSVIDKDRPEIRNFLDDPLLQGIFVLGKSDEELRSWAEFIGDINVRRIGRGLLPLRILGDYIADTSTDGLAKADYPRTEGALGQIDAISRELAESEGNSTITMLALLMVNLGLKE